jgi:ribosomal protein S12 methylthiotransferase accessory factor
MRLERVFLNERVEAMDATFDEDRRNQHRTLGRIYNRTLGPVTGVSLYRPEVFDPSVYSGASRHAAVGALLRDLRVRKGMAEDATLLPGGGKGTSMQRALLGTLGEASERILTVLASSVAVEHLHYATYEDLVADGRSALGPERLPLFAPEQHAQPGFAYEPFRRDTVLSWIEGEDLLSRSPILVPAQLVLFTWAPHTCEAHVGYATSGGLAFHVDRRRAILRGLSEVIERDAVNIRWYCHLPPPMLDLDVEEFLNERMRPEHIRLSSAQVGPVLAFLNTIDVPVPVFTAVATHRTGSDGPFLSGGGAGLGRDEALLQAVLEVGQTRTALRLLSNKHAVSADTPVCSMRDFHHAVLYYGYEKNRQLTSWYTDGAERLVWNDVPTLADDVEEVDVLLLDLLADKGMHPIVVDLTNDAWPGMSLLKVFVPELTQAGIPSRPFLGHPRFYQLPQTLGLADRRLQFHDLSIYPPPLP